MDSRWLLSETEPLALTSPLDRTVAQTHAGTWPLKFLFLWALDLLTEMLPASSARRYLEIHLGQGFLPAALFVCLLTILLNLFVCTLRVFCLHLYWDVCFLFLTDSFRGSLYSLGMSHLLDICIANILSNGVLPFYSWAASWSFRFQRGRLHQAVLLCFGLLCPGPGMLPHPSP